MRRNLFNRGSFPILVIILTLLLSGWTRDPTTVLASPTSGTWTGTTELGYPMSFVISSSGTQWTTLTLKTSYSFDFGSCVGTVEITAWGPGTISNNQFSFSSSTFSFRGQFNTAGTASGIYSITNLRIDHCSSSLTQDGTWTAQISLPTFTDVPFTYWAHDWIERLNASSITRGCSMNPLMYCPDAPVTRAQMAVFLLRGIHGSGYVPPAVNDTVFGDVPSSHWAAKWIQQLYNEGITKGCGSFWFLYCPDSSITRAEMAVFLLRAKHGSGYVPPAPSGTVFRDVPASHWAVEWIERLYAESITGGCDPGLYCPDIPVTRAQMAVFLVRTFNLP